MGADPRRKARRNGNDEEGPRGLYVKGLSTLTGQRTRRKRPNAGKKPFKLKPTIPQYGGGARMFPTQIVGGRLCSRNLLKSSKLHGSKKIKSPWGNIIRGAQTTKVGGEGSHNEKSTGSRGVPYGQQRGLKSGKKVEKATGGQLTNFQNIVGPWRKGNSLVNTAGGKQEPRSLRLYTRQQAGKKGL